MLNDAISIYFADATLASAFVARRCVKAQVETTGGVQALAEPITWRATGLNSAVLKASYAARPQPAAPVYPRAPRTV
jgi:hypothetical protein